ncbi:MAG: ribonuclease P protein component [Pyrinomonadaceae bacterium MAG19_C2-C3]|nr:ribonuclease P protein component [Pyrinomonadaceae bacterium MAG19_C2-C3]
MKAFQGSVRELRHSLSYSAVYKRGKRVNSELFTAFYLRNGLEFHRCGITVSRKFSNKAVARNRAKRLLREAIRQNISTFTSSNFKLDLVLNAKSKLADCKTDEVSVDLQKLLMQVIR